MFLKLFKGTGPGVIILIFIVSIAVWTSSFINPQLPTLQKFDDNPMPLFDLLLKITSSTPLTSVICSYLLVLVVAFLIVNLNTSVFFISQRTFLPALIFILFSGLFPVHQIMNPVLPAAVFFLIAFGRLLKSYKIQGVASTFFDAGLLISIGSLFYAGLIWFGLLLFIGIIILRTGSMKEFIISIIGLITPWFITFGIFYVSGKDFESLLSGITYNLISKESAFDFSTIDIAALTFLGVFIFVSLVQLLSVINIKKIKSRKTFNLLIWTFIIAALCYTLLKPVSIEILWLAAIPCSYLITHYLLFVKKKFFPELFLALFIGLITLVQLLYIF